MQHRTAIILGGGLLVLLTIIVGVLYCSTPYFATDAAMARLADKSLSTTASEGELQTIASNLYAALDQIVPGGQSDQPESVLAQVGRVVMQEVRGQLLAEASRRLASREGLDLALYGWQKVSDRRVTVQRQYLEFPSVFSVVMADATDGTALTELVFVRSGFGGWNLVAVRPHWMRSQGTLILRQIVQAGIQKAMQSDQVILKP
jgi:hypothetical protein